MTDDANAARAALLYEQHQQRQPFSPFAGDAAINDIADAYAVQERLVERLPAPGLDTEEQRRVLERYRDAE